MNNLDFSGWEQKWFPYDKNYNKSNNPLTLPPGKVFECDVRYALASWAHAHGLTFAGVVSEDESYGFEVKIKPNLESLGDWTYDDLQP